MSDLVDIDLLEQQISELLKGNLLSEGSIKKLCDRAKEMLQLEATVKLVNAPVIICGNISGQLSDLIEIFMISGYPPEVNYLFLGGYVNRGIHSIETLSLLIALKLRYRDKITLIRGNHESRDLTQRYEFYDECMSKYGTINVWKYFTDLFDYLPLAAIVESEVFCVHGGLSPSIDSVDDIQNLDRVQEIPLQGPICDLTWTNPSNRLGWFISGSPRRHEFGQDISEKFNHKNEFQLIVRSHQFFHEGYCYMHDRNLVSIFSAPNFNNCGNKAAVLEIDEQKYVKILEFESTPPKFLPKNNKLPDYFLCKYH